jgi:hypothetical protein
MMPIFPALSYWIEYMATFQSVSRQLLYLMILVNMIALLIFPVWLSYTEETDMLLGSFLFLFCTTVWLKLISFHHVMHDVRKLNRRVIRYQKEGKEV